MLKLVDTFLDRITMYRLLLYYLIGLVLVAVGLSAFHVLQYNPITILASAIYITIVCQVSNLVIAKFLGIATNYESAYITALILALIITPLNDPHNFLFLTAAGGLAMASKYVLAINGKHLFNPAAIAVVLTALGPQQSASWWVGTTAMLPYVVLGGLLIVRKIRHGQMVAIFFASAIIVTIITGLIRHANLLTTLEKTAFHSSLFFLAFVMLTEPLTSPTTKKKQLLYAGLVGILFSPQIHVFSLYSTPELALIIGNVYAYVVSSKTKLTPKLIKKFGTTADTADFVFELKKPLSFNPGQYMEFTLAHSQPDSRGNRRYFTLASSPTEDTLRLGVKFYKGGSSFKAAMLDMDDSSRITAAQLAGDFVLPDDPTQKVALIAGGIGVTPYRSMVKYLLDTGEQRDVALLYSEKQAQGFVYRDVFDQAQQQLGLKTVYSISDERSVPTNWAGSIGKIDADMIQREVPDYHERHFYISGPHPMVSAVQDSLRQLGVPRHQIKIDFFPGYA